MRLIAILPALAMMLAVPQPAVAKQQSEPAAKAGKPSLLSAANRANVTRSSKKGGRIIGGIEAREGDFPWQVSLYEKDKTPSSGHFCGGTLIAPQWVLTAAHCLADGTAFRVYDGSASLLGGGQSYEVAKLIVHEGYDPFTSDNDLALVRLGDPVEMVEQRRARRVGEGAKTAALIRPTEAPQLTSPPAVGVVTGWGRTAEQGAGSPALQMIEVPVVARDECNSADKYNGDITENMVCAGGTGKDSCQGDSGGPLVVPREDGQLVLVGVVSWGEGCAKGQFPGIYTNVSRYFEWIERNAGVKGL